MTGDGCKCDDDCRWRAAHARRSVEIRKLHGRLYTAIVALNRLAADGNQGAKDALAEVNRGRV